MSITIKIEPSEFVPVSNEVILVLDSDKKTEGEFLYVVDTNVNGTQVSHQEVSPNLEGYGVFDMSDILKPYVSFNLNYDDTNLFQKMQSGYTKYDVTLSEKYQTNLDILYYGDVVIFATTVPVMVFTSGHTFIQGDRIRISGSTHWDGLQVVNYVINNTTVVLAGMGVGQPSGNTGTATYYNNKSITYSSSTVMTGDKYAVNSALDWREEFDYYDYIMTGSTSKFLSTIPSTTTVKLDDRIWSNFFHKNSNDVFMMEVVSNNGTFHIQNTHHTTDDTKKFLTAGIGPWNIINTTSTKFKISGQYPIIDENTTQYTIRMLNAASGATSETLTFNIDRSCSNYENFRIIFKDRMGSFLNFNFDLIHKRKIDVTRKTFTKGFGSYNSATNTYGHNTWDRGKKILDVDQRETYTINSNWIDEETGNMIVELINSSEAYHLTENDYVYGYNSPIGILSLADAGGYLQINITSHGFSEGDYVLIENAIPAYNNQLVIVTSSSTNSFVTNLPYTSSSLTGTDTVAKRILTGNNGGKLYAINVLTSSIQPKTRLVDKLINYSIDFEYSNRNPSN
jgi:hypothetical protein